MMHWICTNLLIIQHLNQCSCYVQLTLKVPITFKTISDTFSQNTLPLMLTFDSQSHKSSLHISVHISLSAMCSTPLSSYKPLKCTHTVPVWHATITPNKQYFDYFMKPIFTIIFTYLLLLPLTFQCCHVYSWHYLTVKLASRKARTRCCNTNTISMLLNEWKTQIHSYPAFLQISSKCQLRYVQWTTKPPIQPLLMGDLDPHQIHHSFGWSHSPSQTAARLLHIVLQSYATNSPFITMGRPLCASKIAPLHGGIRTPI